MNNTQAEHLKEWEDKVPNNRDQKRKQLKKYGFYISIVYGENDSWKVFMHHKNGVVELLDDSNNYVAVEEKTVNQ